MYKKIIIPVLLLLAPTLVSAIAPTCLLEVYDPTSQSNIWFDNNDRVGQSFYISHAIEVTSIYVYLCLALYNPGTGWVWSDDDGLVYCDIYHADINGCPIGDVLYHGSHSLEGLTKNPTMTHVEIYVNATPWLGCNIYPGAYVITLYTQYPDNVLQWWGKTGDIYAVGNPVRSNNNGSTWTKQIGYDQDFEVWGVYYYPEQFTKETADRTNLVGKYYKCADGNWNTFHALPVWSNIGYAFYTIPIGAGEVTWCCRDRLGYYTYTIPQTSIDGSNWVNISMHYTGSKYVYRYQTENIGWTVFANRFTPVNRFYEEKLAYKV